MAEQLAQIHEDLNQWRIKCSQLQEDNHSLANENERVTQDKLHWQKKLEETQKKSQEYLDQAQIWKEQVSVQC